jgi:phage shock protein C
MGANNGLYIRPAFAAGLNILTFGFIIIPMKAQHPPKLYRSRDNRVIAGVAGGLGEYLHIDPVVVRIIFIILTVFSGSGILLYLVMWLVMPDEKHINKRADEVMHANVKEAVQKVKKIVS